MTDRWKFYHISRSKLQKSAFDRGRNVVEMETIRNARNVLKDSRLFRVCSSTSTAQRRSEGVLNGLHNRWSSPKRVIKADLSATKKRWRDALFALAMAFYDFQKRPRCRAEAWRLKFIFQFSKGEEDKERLLRQLQLAAMPQGLLMKSHQRADSEMFYVGRLQHCCGPNESSSEASMMAVMYSEK